MASVAKRLRRGRRFGLGAGVAVVACALAVTVAPAAYAIYAYYGANYSYNFNNNTGVTVCDQETDGDGAYVQYGRLNGQYNSFQDANGSQPGCSSSTNGQGISKISYFRTCEDHAFAPDPCGSYAYP